MPNPEDPSDQGPIDDPWSDPGGPSRDGSRRGGRQRPEHPEVERSGRSRSTFIGLAIALGLAALVYAAITLGIAGSG